MRTNRRLFGAASLTLAVPITCGALVLVASAYAGRYPYRPVAADRAAAKVASLRQSDVGAAWVPVPSLAAGVPVSTFSCTQVGKTDGLVLTGYAYASFAYRSARGARLGSEVSVFQTPAMNELNWTRTARQDPYRICLSADTQAGLGTNAILVRFDRVPFPRIGTNTVAYRGWIEDHPAATKNALFDVVAFTQGRTQIRLINESYVAPGDRTKVGSIMKKIEVRVTQRLRSRMTQ